VSDTFAVDHNYPIWDKSAKSVVLYSNPEDSNFKETHSALKKMAKKGKIKYFMRGIIMKMT